MKSKENVLAGLLIVLVVATAYGLYQTGHQRPLSPASVAATAAADSDVVDESALDAAQDIIRLPTAPEEASFARDALRLADQEMDLAFADAVRQAATHPAATTPEVRAISARLEAAEQSLATDQGNVAQLTAGQKAANVTRKDALGDQLALATAQADLDQDEVDDARADLIRAGGDPQGRMNAMVQEHEDASKRSDSIRVTITALSEGGGLVHEGQVWFALNAKKGALRQARVAADSAAASFAQQHDALEQRTAPGAQVGSAPADLGHDSSVALLKTTEHRAVDQKTKAALDQRADVQRQLSRVYLRWTRVVNGQQRVVMNRALWGVLTILIIGLLGLFVDQWIEHGLGRLRVERRRLETLRTTIRVSLQVTAILLILLVVFGVPNNFGTFLGLAGAGLTVALKDFIIAFVGWFVLMGRNGIRMGDLVEINAVTGEVVELGLFHTVLLETGDWTDSSHPTGRRVTFTNSYAIEGHYFNFTTSSQWLWDEIRVVVPANRDPHPIAEAMRSEVATATAESGRQAEQEWKGVSRSPSVKGLAGAPAVHIKPVVGGTEIAIRYITRAPDRMELRATINHMAVELLGDKPVTVSDKTVTAIKH